MTPLDAMKQALEYAENQCGDKCNPEYNPCWAREVAYGLKSAIEQMEDAEPVGYLLKAMPIFQERLLPEQNPDKWTALYTAPVAPEFTCPYCKHEQPYAEISCHNCNAKYTIDAVSPEGWRPIETAPKTGRTVLLGSFNLHGNWRTLRGQWYSKELIAEEWSELDDDSDPADLEGWYETSVEAEDIPNCWLTEPTHWMPLPAAPEYGK